MYVKYNNDKTINKFPYTLEELYMEYPLTYFGPYMTNEQLANYNIARVVMTGYPPFDKLEVKPVLDSCEYIQSRDRWETTWKFIPLSYEEILYETELIRNSIVNCTQSRLDDFARTRNYDGILSACTYATSTVPKFQQEAQYCVEARDSTWATLYAIMAEVQSGNRPMPRSFEELEPELPILEWPN